MADDFTTTLLIEAAPETVFDHFTDPALMVRWMGERARLASHDGGAFEVDINGVLIRGHYVSIDRPRRLEIAWGQLGNADMPPGSTRLVVTIDPDETGARLTLIHSGLLPAEAGKHAMGWPHFLARLAVAAPGGDPGPDPFADRPPD